MRRTSSFALLFVASMVASLLSTPTPPAHASAAGPTGVRVVGNHLVDGSGTTLRLVGANRSGLEYACAQGWGLFDGPSDQTSVDAMAAWHMNAVRVPLNEDCWLGINGVSPAYSGTNYQAAVHHYVDELHADGLIAILDLHWSAPGTTRALSQQPMADADHSPAFWSSVAGSFRADPNVVFDLYNEPHDISWSCWRDGCTTSTGWPTAGMQQLVDAVRATGATQPVLAAGLGWAGDLSQWLTWAPTDPAGQLAASAHLYNFSGCNTAACWDQTVAPVAAKVPVVTGEIGENDCAHGFVDAYMAWADRHGVSYLGWSWNTADCAGGPGMISTYDGAPTSFGVGLRSHFAALDEAPATYVLDGYGALHGPAAVRSSDAWPGWNIARSSALLPDGTGGYVLDGWGGVHPFAIGTHPMPPSATLSAGWDQWDIARAVAVLPTGAGGYVLDGWGGVHPFAIGTNPMPPSVTLSAYWAFHDIARGMALTADGTGGYVLDGYGAVHPFAIGTAPLPPDVRVSASWPGWDIARGMALTADGAGGYVLDGWGGVHPFAIGTSPLPAGVALSTYWLNRDVARSMVLTTGGTGGYTLAEDGTVAPFSVGAAAAPPASAPVTLPANAVARAIVLGG